MRRYLQRLISVLIVLMLVVVITACSSGNKSSSTGNTNAGNDSVQGGSQKVENVNIEIWHTYSDTEEKVFLEQVIPLFEKENPSITVKATRMPYEGLKQQVISGVAGNAVPDLMRMDIIWVPEFAKLGALERLDDKEGFADIKSQLFEGPLATNQYNGSYYGLPLNTNTKVAIYNKQLLNDLGVTEVPKTFDELVSLANKMKEKGGFGIGIGGTASWNILPYFWSLGGNITDDQYTKAEGIVNSPESVAALEQIVQWNKEGLVTPTILGGEPGYWDGIKEGKYLMIDDGPWFFSLQGDEAINNNILGQMPSGKGGSISVVGGEDLVMFANSKHKEEAWKFMQFMMKPETQVIMAQAGLIPTNITAANDEKVLSVPYLKPYIEQLKTAKPRTPHPAWAKIEESFNLAVEKAVRGEATPKEALDQAAQEIEGFLQEK